MELAVVRVGAGVGLLTGVTGGVVDVAGAVPPAAGESGAAGKIGRATSEA
jgi:hypothetical protein